jgi:hypothetical protein
MSTIMSFFNELAAVAASIPTLTAHRDVPEGVEHAQAKVIGTLNPNPRQGSECQVAGRDYSQYQCQPSLWQLCCTEGG